MQREGAAGRTGWPGAGARLALAAGVAIAACGTPAPPPPSNLPLPFEQAVDAAADQLVLQARQLAALRSGAPRAVAVLDPMVDATSAQQTAATRQADREAVDRIGGRLEPLDLQPLAAATWPHARFLLTGSLARVEARGPQATSRVNLALVDLTTRAVVAQSWAIARGDTVDAMPTPCDSDSPVRLHDPVHEARVTTAATGTGRPAQAVYLEHLAVAAHLAEAERLCNDGEPADAFDRFQRAAAVPGGAESPRVLNGLYVTATRLKRPAEADRAFDRLVARGLANREFDVKFLFNAGSTVLTPDSRYPSWLRRIARASAAAKVCLQIVGHGGSAGTPAAAEALSLQRAAYIRQRLVGEAAVLGKRTRATGAGSQQNLVGTGTDNAIDALDRRIEFRVVGCG